MVNDYFLDELHWWQEQQSENEKWFGKTYIYVYRESSGRLLRQSKSLLLPGLEKVSLVCTKIDGQICSRTSIIELPGKEGFNAHSFRHTHATRLIECGANPKGVAGRLGHASIRFTQTRT